MIEIHSHILPGLDDGAYDLSEALLMARQAVSSGVQTMIATPHHLNGRFFNPSDQIVSYVQTLQKQLDEHQIPLRLLPGQEIRVHTGLMQDFEEGTNSTLCYSRYVLLELPPDHIPSFMTEIMNKLSLLGKIPIIAHPERNREIVEQPKKLLQLVEKGALTQIAAHSLLGVFGKSTTELSLSLCRGGLAHFVSSDAHNTSNKGFALDRAYKVMGAKLGEEMVRTFQQNAHRVIQNVEIPTEAPSWAKPKWFQIWKAYAY